MAGYAPGEFAPDLAALSSKFHPSDKSRILGILEEVSKGTLEFVDVEFRFLCRDNTHIWIRSRGKAVAFDRKGKPQRLLGTHSDITDRKPAEEKLGKARNYISNIIDSMPSVLIGVDSQGRVTQWNSEADYDLKKQYDFKTIKIVREYEANLSPASQARFSRSCSIF